MIIILGILVMVAIGVTLYLVEKDRMCPKCGKEMTIWSYKKMICSNRNCGHTTT